MTADTDALEFETPIEDDVDDLDLPAGRRTVYTDPADAEIDSLYSKYKRGKLVVQPDFQREYVWDIKRASRLVESALLNIPIPIVYISEEPENKEYVIDAFYNATYLKYKPPMKAFLNRDAQTKRNISIEETRDLRAAFKNACQITRSMFGKSAFKRFYRGTDKHPNGYWEQKKFNASLYDIILCTFHKKTKTVFSIKWMQFAKH